MTDTVQPPHGAFDPAADDRIGRLRDLVAKLIPEPWVAAKAKATGNGEASFGVEAWYQFEPDGVRIGLDTSPVFHAFREAYASLERAAREAGRPFSGATLTLDYDGGTRAEFGPGELPFEPKPARDPVGPPAVLAFLRRVAEEEDGGEPELDDAGRVVSLDLPSHDVTLRPDDWPVIGQMRSLRRLDLWGALDADDQLAHLAGLTELEDFNAARARLTPAGYGHLGALTSLRMLRLHESDVDDAGLAAVAALGRLELLLLHQTCVTGAGLAHLRGLDRLATVSLAKTKVDDAGLAHLAALPALTTVGLEGTPVTDAGVAALARVPRLTFLNLSGTRVTDAAVDALAGMRRLRQLDLRRTLVTAAGVARLRDASPYLAIHADPPPDCTASPAPPPPSAVAAPPAVVPLPGRPTAGSARRWWEVWKR